MHCGTLTHWPVALHVLPVGHGAFGPHCGGVTHWPPLQIFPAGHARFEPHCEDGWHTPLALQL